MVAKTCLTGLFGSRVLLARVQGKDVRGGTLVDGTQSKINVSSRGQRARERKALWRMSIGKFVMEEP